MAIARPPTYRTRSKRPRRIAQKGAGRGGGNPMIASVTQRGGSTGLKSTPAAAPGWTSGPTASPQEVTPQTSSVPTVGSIAPPATPQAAADRITAREQYGTGMGDVNYQLRQAAQEYGGAPNVNQYGYSEDPSHPGVYLDSVNTANVQQMDPNSALAVIMRNQEAQSRAQNENANQHNTFFSGLNLKGQQNILDENDRGRAAALQQYNDAVHKLTTILETLRGTRQEGFRNADAADLQAAANLPPEPEADSGLAPGPESPPGTPAPAPWGVPPSLQVTNGVQHTLTTKRPRRKSARGRIQGTSTVSGGRL